MNELETARYWIEDLKEKYDEAYDLNIYEFLRLRIKTETITVGKVPMIDLPEAIQKQIREYASFVIKSEEGGYEIRT